MRHEELTGPQRSGAGPSGSARTPSALTVAEAGEAAVLARVLAEFSPVEAARVGPGDDCAVLRLAGDTVITTDTMIEGPDFRLDWHTAHELGWKLAATNLSDVAAMGAVPVSLTVAFAVPETTEVAFLAGVAAGIDEGCRTLAPGCGVVGGDLGRAPVVMAAVTAVGDLRGRAPVLRSGAQPGDTLAYAGQLGLAGMGLARLASGEFASHRGNTAVQDDHARGHAPVAADIRAQLTPDPPLALGVIAAASGATAMLDVSDGLSLDAQRIAQASNVRIDLEHAALTKHFGQQEGKRVPLDAMLFGGEDHGLLATFPPETTLPVGFFPIGRVYEHTAAHDHTLTLDGRVQPVKGWDPFHAAW